jgi:competence protein ComEA
VSRSGAAFGLALALAAAGLAPAEQPAPACPAPAELAARGPHSAAVACGAAGPAGGLRGPARLLFGQGLDPNRADVAALEALPRVGPARAAAIAAERCRRPFASPAELVRVAGIGPATAAQLSPWLAVEEPPRADCAAASASDAHLQ